ncbi:unnamed protein product [Rhizoctonia solani]|uniref:F-box domain-containing protein n=1 Tax=Rhizoctonia solani TaxID=456999 RepID=A0A8H3D1I5_9AGAM|nr:unnamed protein product [Rhizoctonia solani]
MTEPVDPFGLFGCFSDLSDEIVIQVLHFCNYEEILRFAATSKRYYNIVASSVGLRLHIELEVNGLEIIKGTRNGNAAHSVLLDELVRYRDAWLNLRLEEPVERTLMERAQTLLWELREGSYTVALSSTPNTSLGPDTLWITLFDHLDTSNRITFHDHFHAFTSDLEQDLVACLKMVPSANTRFEIKLCSATTGLAHPLAQNYTFIVQADFRIPDPEEDPDSVSIEIMDNIFVARVADLSDEYEILAWDWKSGALLLRIGSSSGIADFSFLDTTHLVIFSADRNKLNLPWITLSLYPVTPRALDEETAGSYFRASKYACARPILTFRFPELKRSFRVKSSDFTLRSDPTPGRPIYTTKSAGFAHSTALTFVATLSLIDKRRSHLNHPLSNELQVCISAGPLLRYLFEYAGEVDTIVIPWATWGTKTTRWFLRDQGPYNSLWTYGSRFVRAGSDVDPISTLYDLLVFDFHPPTVKRHGPLELIYPPTTDLTAKDEAKLRKLVLEGNVLAVAHVLRSGLSTSSATDANPPQVLSKTIHSDLPTVITEGFSAPVESRLPYRVVIRPKFVPECEEWLIDGNYVIGMSPSRDDSDVVDRILVYKLHT